jgi:hypothetical protein
LARVPVGRLANVSIRRYFETGKRVNRSTSQEDSQSTSNSIYFSLGNDLIAFHHFRYDRGNRVKAFRQFCQDHFLGGFLPLILSQFFDFKA